MQVGSGRQDVEFCSITIDDGSQMTDDSLQRKLQEISRLREQLQQMEIELARTIARSEILELQNTYEVKLKEQIDINNNLKVSNTCTLLFRYKREVCLIFLNCWCFSLIIVVALDFSYYYSHVFLDLFKQIY